MIFNGLFHSLHQLTLSSTTLRRRRQTNNFSSYWILATRIFLIKTSSRRPIWGIWTSSINYIIPVPTITCFKCMMKCKREKMIEENCSRTKVFRKWTPIEGGKDKKMLKWIWMGSTMLVNEHWVMSSEHVNRLKWATKNLI